MEHEVKRAARLKEQREQVAGIWGPGRRADVLEEGAEVIAERVVESSGASGARDRCIELRVVAVVEDVQRNAANEVSIPVGVLGAASEARVGSGQLPFGLFLNRGERGVFERPVQGAAPGR